MDLQTKLSPRSALALLSLALATACSSSGSLDAALSAADAPSVNAEAARLHSDVAWLADDARGGRRAGTAEAKQAADWIAERLGQVGLVPAGAQSGWLQEFAVPLPIEDGGGSYVKSGASDFQGPEQVVPLFCSAGAKADGALAFCGYGIENAEVGWNDFAKLRGDQPLAGKIVLVVRGAPKLAKKEADLSGKDNQLVAKGDSWVATSTLFNKVMNAKRRGAAAVLIAQHPSLHDQPLSKFDASRTAQASIPALLVSAAVARELLPDYDLRVNDLDRPGDTLLSTTPPVRPAVSVLADVRREKGAAYNVLGRLEGEDSRRVVLVGAHYDHLGHGDVGSLAQDMVGEVHNGADDNASGVAAVLEIARILAAGQKPACDVVFALWSGEELGLLGSEYWAEHPTVPLKEVGACLNLDMVGRAGSGRLQVLGAGTAEPFVGWLEADAPGCGLELAINASGQGIGGSDHQTFLKRDIPALHLFSGVHEDYHKPSDDTERFEAEGAARVVELAVDLTRQMAAAGRLAFVEPKIEKGQTPEQKPGDARWRVWFGSVPEYSYTGKGVLLAGTSSGSPAERAGMLKGDVLLQVGDVKIDTIEDFMYALQLYKPGDTVLARYKRDGKDESVRVTLATRDAQ